MECHIQAEPATPPALLSWKRCITHSHKEPFPGDCVQNVDAAVVFVLPYAPKDVDTLGVRVIGSCVTMQARWHGILQLETHWKP